MGTAFQIHDFCATEGPGPIQDREAEHLASSDVGIIATRKRLLAATRDVEVGHDPPHVLRRPEDNAFPDLVTIAAVIPDDLDHRRFWRDAGLRPARAGSAS